MNRKEAQRETSLNDPIQLFMKRLNSNKEIEQIKYKS